MSVFYSLTVLSWLLCASIGLGSIYCPSSCQWTLWSSQSPCSQTCGSSGVQSRYRNATLTQRCIGPWSACNGGSTETNACNRICLNGGQLESLTCSCHPGFQGTCCNENFRRLNKVEEQPLKELTWSPPSFLSCVMRLLIEGQTGWMSLSLVSKNRQNGKTYGTDVEGTVTSTTAKRVVCLEYKCSGYQIDITSPVGQTEIHVDGHLSVISQQNCTIQKFNSLLNETGQIVKEGVTGAKFSSKAHVNYGASYGIYVANGESVANGQCYGTDGILNSAVIFNCT